MTQDDYNHLQANIRIHRELSFYITSWTSCLYIYCTCGRQEQRHTCQVPCPAERQSIQLLQVLYNYRLILYIYTYLQSNRTCKYYTYINISFQRYIFICVHRLLSNTDTQWSSKPRMLKSDSKRFPNTRGTDVFLKVMLVRSVLFFTLEVVCKKQLLLKSQRG